MRAVARPVDSQGVTGALIGTVQDQHGGVIAGAQVRISSTALIGSPESQTTNEKGQLRFVSLPPGVYVLDIEFQGFASWHEEDLYVRAGGTIERTVRLALSGLAQSVIVEGAGSRIEARNPGFATRFGREDLDAIPTRRVSMFDFVRAAPGLSPTSPTERHDDNGLGVWLRDERESVSLRRHELTPVRATVSRGRNPASISSRKCTCSRSGRPPNSAMSRAPSSTSSRKQGSARFLFDASYYGQTAGLTGQPVVLPLPMPSTGRTGYERVRYRDLTTSVGGPVVRDHLWFFAGHQYLRDYDSQPGTDSALPRIYAQNKSFAKLTWKLAPGLQLVQSVHHEYLGQPRQPTRVTPLEATAADARLGAGHHLRASVAHVVAQHRVGGARRTFVYSQEGEPSSGSLTTPSRFDRVTGVTSDAPSQFGNLTIRRTSIKAIINHYRPGFLGADHQWKTGVQIERG